MPTDAEAGWMQLIQSRTEAALERLLPDTAMPPARLHAAMRYVVLGGGKRVRPLLCHAAGEMFSAPVAALDAAACAVELIHGYSLVHDDLPCMDDDVLRRGKPTTHVQFDEATAVLAGDGLLTFAFDILSRTQTHLDAAVRVELVSALARAAGIGGMVGGQMLDLAAEGRFSGAGPQRLGEEGVLTLQAMKTGALLRFACQAGGMLGSGTPAQRKALERFGAAVGQAFQIADDLLDVEGDTALVGKQTGKDAGAGKATMVDILGLDGAKARLRELVTEAEQSLASFGNSAAVLIEGARFVADRRM